MEQSRLNFPARKSRAVEYTFESIDPEESPIRKLPASQRLESESKEIIPLMGDYSQYVAPPRQQVIVKSVGRKRKAPAARRRGRRLPQSIRDLAYAQRLEKYKQVAQENLAAIPQRGSALNLAMFGYNKRLANERQLANRNALGYRGRGDYKKVAKWIPRIGGALSGAALGYQAGGLGGAVEGAKSGWGAGRSFSKFMGWGDYRTGTSGNQLMDSQSNISVNQSNASGDVWIEHTEFVQNVTASNSGAGNSSFNAVQFPLNPGLSTTFPFLSQLAQSYLLYEFHGLIFQYKPNSGESGASSNALGKVIMATDYDPDGAAFFNSVQMENEDYANSCKPSVGMLHGVETHPQQSLMDLKYVRTGTSTKAKSFTDLGNLYIATEGIPFSAAGTQILGELWVTYRVRLSRANLYGSLLGANIQQDCIYGTTSASALISTINYKSSNQIGCVVANVSATAFTITFPTNISLGSYLITVEFYSGATVFTTQLMNTISAASNMTFWRPSVSLPSTTPTQVSGPFPTYTGTTSNQRIMQMAYITITAPGNTQAACQFNCSAPGLTATTTYIICIQQINQNMGLELV